MLIKFYDINLKGNMTFRINTKSRKKAKELKVKFSKSDSLLYKEELFVKNKVIFVRRDYSSIE